MGLTTRIRARLEQELTDLHKRQRAAALDKVLVPAGEDHDGSSADLWPSELTLPMTVREALEVVEREAGELAGELAQGITGFAQALVSPALVDAVLSRQDLADLWPWPEPWPQRDGPGIGWAPWAELRRHTGPARSVTSEKGDPGNYWWAMPTELLRLPTNRPGGKVHVLAPVLAQKWRTAWGKRKHPGALPEARMGVELLADTLAVQGARRRHDPRVADTLRAALEAGQACGLVGDWRVERGELEQLTGTIYATPGRQAPEVLQTRSMPKPAWIPATGAELAQWFSVHGLTRAAAAELLGIPAGTLCRVPNTHRDRPLPPRVRTAIRRYLWPKKGDE